MLLIDVAFVQVRPSPWRQAVDLANMMLVLAVRTDAERVYQRALRFFTPDEIAEAFAAARGIASPTQLRTAMKHDGRDLLGRSSGRWRRSAARSRCSGGRPTAIVYALALARRRSFVAARSSARPAHAGLRPGDRRDARLRDGRSS